MRKLFTLFLTVFLGLTLLSGCAMLQKAAIDAGADALVSGLSGGSSGSSGSSSSSSSGSFASGAVEFQNGEFLICEAGANESLIGEGFYVGRVLTAASKETKNQAQIIAVSDGTKAWVNWVVPSRKATKADLVVGTSIFFPYYNSYSETMEVDDYRKTSWALGTITSIDELFKNRIEIDGKSFNFNLCRVPTVPVN